MTNTTEKLLGSVSIPLVGIAEVVLIMINYNIIYNCKKSKKKVIKCQSYLKTLVN